MWTLKWGEHYESGYYFKLLTSGALRPEDYKIDIGPLDIYIESFWELSSERSFGFGVGPIPFSSIMKYCEIFEIENVDDFLFYIRQLDQVFISFKNKDKKETKKNGKR